MPENFESTFKCAADLDAGSCALAPEGSCPHIGLSVCEGSSGRLCLIDRCFCSGFADPVLFKKCPTYRKQKKC